MVEVIRTHADAHQFMNQITLDVNAVVHARQQHGLVTEGDAGARQFISCFAPVRVKSRWDG